MRAVLATMVLSRSLRKAAENGDIGTIVEWFSSGSRDPDERDGAGFTLLHDAAFGNACDIMRFLLEKGADVNAAYRRKWPPTNHVLPWGSDLPENFDTGLTPLHSAANRGYHEAAALLLENGARIEARTLCSLGPSERFDETPLHFAGRGGKCDMIRFLLHSGAILDARNNRGQDAETNAHYNSKPEAAVFIASLKRAGGWCGYLRAPRKDLLALRILAEMGRCSTHDGLLARLFPAPRSTRGPTTRSALRALRAVKRPRGRRPPLAAR